MGESVGDKIRQKVTGNAHVGVVAGAVGGDIRFGSANYGTANEANEELGRRLEEFLAAVAEAHAVGTIDHDTADDVEKEVKTAREELPVADERARKSVVRALRKAKGLIEGTAELTSKVSAAIAAAQGVL